WGPRAIGDHGAPVSLPTLKKAYKKGTRGISWGSLQTPGPRAVKSIKCLRTKENHQCHNPCTTRSNAD
ncbi:unnamed protein product, partial [Staurois parvus]